MNIDISLRASEFDYEFKSAVLCGTRAEFDEFKKLYHDQIDRYIYIHSADRLNGNCFEKIITFGTWYFRKHLVEELLILKTSIIK